MRIESLALSPEAGENGEIDARDRDPDQVITDILGDTPRAAYWRELRQVLSSRLTPLLEERDTLPDPSPERLVLDKRIHEMREQIHALRTEEAVTQFLEDSIRASLNRPQSPSAWDAYAGEYEE